MFYHTTKQHLMSALCLALSIAGTITAMPIHTATKKGNPDASERLVCSLSGKGNEFVSQYAGGLRMGSEYFKAELFSTGRVKTKFKVEKYSLNKTCAKKFQLKFSFFDTKNMHQYRVLEEFTTKALEPRYKSYQCDHFFTISPKIAPQVKRMEVALIPIDIPDDPANTEEFPWDICCYIAVIITASGAIFLHAISYQAYSKAAPLKKQPKESKSQ